MIHFTVYGKPAPQGSLRPYRDKNSGRLGVKSDNKRTEPWRQQVAGTALAQSGPYSGDGTEPIEITLGFFFARPKSAKKRMYPTVKPDIDKCVRAILDSLTGICYRDDAQVVQIRTYKSYDSQERVVITVGRL